MIDKFLVFQAWIPEDTCISWYDRQNFSIPSIDSGGYVHFLVPNIPLWILLIPVKVRRRIPDNSHLEFDCSEREIRGWVMARQSISLMYWEWIGGLQLWNCSYALHTVLIPSSYGVTVYCVL